MAKKKARRKQKPKPEQQPEAVQIDGGDNVDAWRSARVDGQSTVTPSGLRCVLRKVSLLDLILTPGDYGATAFPSKLDPLINEVVDDGFDVSQFKKYVDVVNPVVAACFVNPVCSMQKADVKRRGGIWIGELTSDDRLQIFNWAIGGQDQLKPFRPESAT